MIAKNGILKQGVIVLLFNFICIYVAHAQYITPKPTACSIAPDGFELGGDFINRPITCSTPTDPNIDLAVTFRNNGVIALPNAVQYVFDYNDDIDITANDFSEDYAGWNGTTFTTKKTHTPGVHWIL